MKVRQLLKSALSVALVMSAVVLVGGNTASALPTANANKAAAAKLSLVHEQFAATGFPTFYQDNITNPPQIGQGFTLDESLRDAGGGIIGSSSITCKIIAFTPVPPTLQFACNAPFSFNNGGTLKGITTFNFNPANLPAFYDAYILSGTGAYAGAVGVIHVTDPGPGNPTGYVFDFYHL